MQTNADLAQQLQELTGNLTAGPGGSEELERARRLLVQAMLRGQKRFLDSISMARLVTSRADAATPARLVRSLADVATPARLVRSLADVATPSAQLLSIAAEESLYFKGAKAGAGVEVMLRATPSALGRPQETLGPFFGLDGRRVWLDVLAARAASPIIVVIGAGNQVPFLVLADGVSQRDSLTFDLPAGSISINAATLASDTPFATFIGIRITGGTATFSEAPVLAGDTLRVSPSASLILEINPEVPVGPTNFEPPSKARMTFDADALTGFTAETATISTFGAVVQFSPVGFPILERGALHFGGDLAVLNTAAATGAVSIHIDGTWTVERAFWSFYVVPLNKDAPGHAYDAGIGTLDGGPGLNLSWTGRRTPVPLARALALAYADGIYLRGTPTTVGGRQTISDPDGATLAEVRFDNLTKITVTRDGHLPPEHRVTARCSADLTGILPLYADGEGLQHKSGKGEFEISELHDRTAISLFLDDLIFKTAEDLGDAGNDRKALALSNAILTVSAPREGRLDGDLLPGGAVAGSSVRFGFDLLGVLPTLADPYVSNFDAVPRAGLPNRMEVTVTRLAEGAPRVEFAFPDSENPAFPLLSLMPEPGIDSLEFFGERITTPRVAEEISRSGVTHWLLDVSTNSDQFGVAIGNHSQQVNASIRDWGLEWDGLDMLVFTVPAIQWEPVSDSVSGALLSTDDGGPSAFAVDTVHLVPVAPIAAARQLIDEYRNGEAGHASITLPFGIRALVRSTDANGAASPFRPAIALDHASFPGFDTARQIRLSATSSLGILGSAHQTNNVPDGNIFAVALSDTNVLAFKDVPGGTHVVDRLFNAVFRNNFASATVPVQRYDWSGYGASVFSQWVNPEQMPPNVSQVQFDVVTGRTSHEVVQVSAILWPCQAFLVRTITLERENSAAVVRHDSGWIASSPGLFFLPGVLPINQRPFHRGVVRGYFNIREIRDTPRTITVGTAQFQAVYFDADVEVEGVVKGDRGGRVPVQRHAGYVQFLPVGPLLLGANELTGLFKQEGPIGGPLDCEIDIAGSGNRMVVNSMFTELTASFPPESVIAVRGRPVFPSSGSWTAVRTNRARQTTAVDPHSGIPLIREGLVVGGVQNALHRFADPADLFQRNAPETEYGFLFSTSSSRTLLPSPEVELGKTKVTSPFPARMADPSAVAISNGLFPKADSALQFPGNYALDFAGANILDLKSATRGKELELISTKVMRLYVESSAGFNTLVNAADWKVDSSLQTIFLDLLSFKKILSFKGTWLTDNLGARKLDNASMDLSEDIDELKAVLDILNNLHLPQAVEFSLRTIGSGTLALDISVEGHLANDDGTRIDVGLGKLSGMLRMGVVIRASITDGVQGEAYLEISGDFQQAIIPDVLYAGGFLRFRIGIDQEAKAILELNVGVVGSVGGDLIPGLIEVEGTAKYGYVIVLPELDAGRIRLGATVGMEVRANLISGLVAIKFGFEAGATMGLVPENHNLVIITVQINVSASVTAAWVFKARVSFHAEYTTEFPKLAAAAVLAFTGVGVGPAAALAVS